MKHIAVICALPPERNTGMATVDLAAHTALRALMPEANFTFYTLGKLGPYAFAEGELPFHYVDIADAKQDFFAADAWVYWGDFMHAQSYWAKDRGSWDGEASDAARMQMRNDAEDFIFLKSLPDAALKKAILFGGTIITNDASVIEDPAYKVLSSRLFSNAGAVYLRDAISAALVSPLLRKTPTLGCDCALLLSDDDLHALPAFKKASGRDGIGVFFGRTAAKVSMLTYSRAIGKQMGMKCTWLPWFHTPRRMRLLASLFGYQPPGAPRSVDAILSELSGYAYIITDTYHLAVNAWRMGIPAICIGMAVDTSQHSLSDKKKEILYEMIGARRFYTFSESLRFGGNGLTCAKQAAAALRDERVIGEVMTNIRAHQETSRERLRAALIDVIG